jgi:hypothetical protein
VVEDMISATPPQIIIQFQKHRRQIRGRKFENHVSSNIISNQEKNNSRAVTVTSSRTDQHKNSVFIRTAIDWNHLEESIVITGNIEEFKNCSI